MTDNYKVSKNMTYMVAFALFSATAFTFIIQTYFPAYMYNFSNERMHGEQHDFEQQFKVKKESADASIPSDDEKKQKQTEKIEEDGQDIISNSNNLEEILDTVIPPKYFNYPNKKTDIPYLPSNNKMIGPNKNYSSTCQSEYDCPSTFSCNRNGYCVPQFTSIGTDIGQNIIGRGRDGEGERTFNANVTNLLGKDLINLSSDGAGRSGEGINTVDTNITSLK